MQIALKNASPIQVEAVVRTVPKQREVVRGVWENQTVYAKKFIGGRAHKHLKRDVKGVLALMQANIATPALLFQATLQHEVGYVAIYAAIADAQNAEVLYPQLEQNARFELMQKLVAAVAQLHNANLIQTDLYFKNFLLAAETLYTLDGDGIRHLRPLFKKHQQMRNLATLFSKMEALDDDWITQLFERYCALVGWRYSLDAEINVWSLTQQIRHQVAQHYASKKVFRNCTDVKVLQDFRRFVALARDFLVDEKTLNTLDDFLVTPSRNIKNGNTCTIAKATIAGVDVVIKRYNIKNCWHGLNRALRKSRAALSWQNAHYLKILNMATPLPLALVEERLGWLRRRAYFLSAYVDAPDIAQFFAQTADVKVKQAVAYEVALMFYQLYLLKISHGDCKASNIKIVHGKPMLLDLDAMQVDAWFFRQKHVKDLKRFMRNWVDDIAMLALFKHAFEMAYDENPWEQTVLELAGIS